LVKSYGRPLTFWRGSQSIFTTRAKRLVGLTGDTRVESRVLDIMFLGDESEGELKE